MAVIGNMAGDMAGGACLCRIEQTQPLTFIYRRVSVTRLLVSVADDSMVHDNFSYLRTDHENGVRR